MVRTTKKTELNFKLPVVRFDCSELKFELVCFKNELTQHCGKELAQVLMCAQEFNDFYLQKCDI